MLQTNRWSQTNPLPHWWQHTGVLPLKLQRVSVLNSNLRCSKTCCGPLRCRGGGRVAAGFNDNSSDDRSDNPPAFPADCREPALCSRLPLLVWWRFIFIWMDHQLDKQTNSLLVHVCRVLGETNGARACVHTEGCGHVHVHTHTSTLLCRYSSDRYINREFTTGQCGDPFGWQVLLCP